MQGEELAKNGETKVGYNGVQRVVVGPDTREIDLVGEDGVPIARLYILGSASPIDRLLIGVSLQQEDRAMTAVVHGPLVPMTSEHVRASGRSVAEFPGSTLAEVMIERIGSGDVAR